MSLVMASKKGRTMLIVSLFVHIQHCLERYKNRKALVSLNAQQISDIGITYEEKQAELAKASVLGFACDLLRHIKQGRRE